MSFTTRKTKEQLNAILNFDKNEDGAVYKSAAMNSEESLEPFNSHGVSRLQDKGRMQMKPIATPLTVWKINDKAFLDQHVMLNDDVTADDAFEFLLQQIRDISEGYKNYRDFEQEKKIVGFHFDETREGLYRVELFELKENLGVNCTRLDGDGFAVTKLWEALKNALVSQGLTVAGTEIMGETDDETFFSDDDEEFDMDLDMDSFKYLDLARDPTFVNRMIHDIEDFNVGTHSLMLLAFNLLSSANQQFLTERYAQQIFDAIVARLMEPMYVTLPVVRCAGRIIEKLIESDSISISVKQMQAILATIQRWAMEDPKAQKSTVIPTASEEATVLLSSVFGEMKNAMTDQFDMSEKIQDICNSTIFEQVEDNLAPFVAAN